MDKIQLAELKINYCSACYACKKLGYCVKREDMEQVIAKMRAARLSEMFAGGKKVLSMELVRGCLVTSKEILPCSKRIRWVKVFVEYFQ